MNRRPIIVIAVVCLAALALWEGLIVLANHGIDYSIPWD